MIVIKECWYVAAWSRDVEPGSLFAARIAGEPIVLFRTADGSIQALADLCPHRLAPLSLGSLEGGAIRCNYHGIKFDARGLACEVPGGRVPSGLKVRRYPVAERGTWVWVWLGDPATASTDLIPETFGLDHPDWSLKGGNIDYEADYQLINDNLTDFSHVSYLHKASFAESEDWATIPARVKQLPRGINVQRWVDTADNSFGAQWGISGADQWTEYDYLVPGILHMRSSVYAREAKSLSEGGRPLADLVPVYETYTAQAVTPLAKGHTRYFFSTGTSRSPNGLEIAEALLKVELQAFEEDRIMIEAQYRNIESLPSEKMNPFTTGDKGPVLMRRVLEGMANKQSTEC